MSDAVTKWEKDNKITRRREAAASAAYKIVYDTMDQYREQIGRDALDELDIALVIGATLERLGHYVQGHFTTTAMLQDGVANER